MAFHKSPYDHANGKRVCGDENDPSLVFRCQITAIIDKIANFTFAGKNNMHSEETNIFALSECIFYIVTILRPIFLMP